MTSLLTQLCQTWTLFASKQEEELLMLCDKYFKTTLEGGINREQYLLLMEQLEQEPDPEEIPPDYSDLPEIVLKAVTVYNSLPDTYITTMDRPIFNGKDLTGFRPIAELYGVVELEEQRVFLDILHIINMYTERKRSSAKPRR